MTESQPATFRRRKWWLSIAAALAVVSLVITYGLVHRRHADAVDADRELDRAAGLLESPSPERRLAGIRALEELAVFTSAPDIRSATARMLRIVDKLTGHIRGRARPAKSADTAEPAGRVDTEIQLTLNVLGTALASRLISGSNSHERSTRIDLHGVDLAGADLTGLDLAYVNLNGVDLRRTRLTGTRLRDARMGRANLRELDLRGVDLVGAELVGADLTGANLHGVRLERAILKDTIVDRANLTGVDLTGAFVTGLRFTGAVGLSPDHALVFTAVTALSSPTAKTRRAAISTLAGYLPHAPPQRADLVGIADDGLLVLVNKHKGPTDTPWPPPPPAELQAALTALVNHARPADRRLYLAEAHLQGAILERANLHNADLHHANLTGANLHGAILTRADLWAADLTFADVTGADLTGAAISTSSLSQVKGLTTQQVAGVHLGPHAQLPPGVTRPDPSPSPTR